MTTKRSDMLRCQSTRSARPSGFNREVARDLHTAMDCFLFHWHWYARGNCSAHCNRLVEEQLRGNWLRNQRKSSRLDAIVYHLAESLRIIAILISPILPKAAHGIFDQLNWKMELSGKEERFSLADAEWGRLPDGHVVGKPVPLFPRIEIVN